MMHHNPHMLPKIRSDAIMSAANGAPCTLKLAGMVGERCAPADTVVGCHLPVWGKGIGTKVTDLAVAFGCARCHQILDGVDKGKRDYIEAHYRQAYELRLLHALTETHALLLSRGIIVIPDGEII